MRINQVIPVYTIIDKGKTMSAQEIKMNHTRGKNWKSCRRSLIYAGKD